MAPPDSTTAQHIDDTIRGAIAASGVLGRGDEVVVRYVVMAETMRFADDGSAHYQQYKIVPPDQSRGCSRELLETGLSWTSGAGDELRPGA